MDSKVACIILNYNDADSTISLLKSISNYDILNKIIIVDGCSTDNSINDITQYLNDKVILLKARKNGGYGYGNNIGIEYCLEHGIRYGVIANPDVVFTEYTLTHIFKIIKREKNCVAISPSMYGREEAIKMRSVWKDIWASSILINRIMRVRHYPRNTFKKNKYYKVDALSGALVLFDLYKFKECKLYDENVFLYNEEVIIGKKFLKKGYDSIIDMSVEYYHKRSVSIKKNINSIIKLKSIVLKSHYYYLKEYANANILQLVIFDMTKPFKYIEAVLWAIIRKVM